MNYRIEWEQEARQSLLNLDPTIVHRIVDRVSWLSLNFDNIRPKRLTARLRGYYRIRVGDYRIIYSIIRKDRILVVNYVGHRKDIYK